MTVSAELLSILACPSVDHAPLVLSEVDGESVLVCTLCASRFPIRDGIPVLLADEATPGPNGLGVAADGSGCGGGGAGDGSGSGDEPGASGDPST